MKRLATAALALAISACVPTYGAISMTPIEIPGVGTAYRYQGRANFQHQIAEADRMMAEHCAKVGGGRPVILNQNTRNIGFGGTGHSTASTYATGSATEILGGYGLQGSATTTGYGTTSVMANQNQEILFRCKR